MNISYFMNFGQLQGPRAPFERVDIVNDGALLRWENPTNLLFVCSVESIASHFLSFGRFKRSHGLGWWCTHVDELRRISESSSSSSSAISHCHRHPLTGCWFSFSHVKWEKCILHITPNNDSNDEMTNLMEFYLDVSQVVLLTRSQSLYGIEYVFDTEYIKKSTHKRMQKNRLQLFRTHTKKPTLCAPIRGNCSTTAIKGLVWLDCTDAHTAILRFYARHNSRAISMGCLKNVMSGIRTKRGSVARKIHLCGWTQCRPNNRNAQYSAYYD